MKISKDKVEGFMISIQDGVIELYSDLNKTEIIEYAKESLELSMADCSMDINDKEDRLIFGHQQSSHQLIGENPEIVLAYYNKSIDERIIPIQNYFKEMEGIILGDDFDLETFCKEAGVSIENGQTALVNLEGDGIMIDIRNGDYDTFNLFDRDQFNDCYTTMMEDMFSLDY